VTEQQWRQSSNPEPMLEFLRGKDFDRKLRLFACACCRRIWDLLTEPGRTLIEVVERWADGEATQEECWAAANRCYQASRGAAPHSAEKVAASAATAAAGGGAWAAAWNVVSEVRRAMGTTDPARQRAEGAIQAALLREIIPAPMWTLPALDPGILAWQDSLVRRLASGIYEGRDFTILPILADALEESGCDDFAILTHCRGPGPHTLGCWPLDCILGKG
jgi:hypothetical protein